MRERIAHVAARLIAEDGAKDFAAAKRKAARQLGAPDTHNLPSNHEIQTALKAYQTLYQGEAQQVMLKKLRLEALRFMQLLEPFDPCLTGSVLTGTATRHSAIDLIVFADDAKEIEMFLLARNLPYSITESRSKPIEGKGQISVFILNGDEAEVIVRVLPFSESRRSSKDIHNGDRSQERARIKQLEGLLATKNSMPSDQPYEEVTRL